MLSTSRPLKEEEEEEDLPGAGTPIRPSSLFMKERRGRLRPQAATATCTSAGNAACGGRRAWLTAALLGVAGLAVWCHGGAASDGRKLHGKAAQDQETRDRQLQEQVRRHLL